MKTVPEFDIVPVEKVEPGKWFFLTTSAGSELTLYTDMKGHFGKLAVSFGPFLQTGVAGPHLFSPDNSSCAVFKLQPTIKLSTNPADWFESAPEDQSPCVAITGETVFVRINSAMAEGGYRACFVGTSNGASSGTPRFPAVYVRSWKLVIPGSGNTVLPILTVNGNSIRYGMTD